MSSSSRSSGGGRVKLSSGCSSKSLTILTFPPAFTEEPGWKFIVPKHRRVTADSDTRSLSLLESNTYVTSLLTLNIRLLYVDI